MKPELGHQLAGILARAGSLVKAGIRQVVEVDSRPVVLDIHPVPGNRDSHRSEKCETNTAEIITSVQLLHSQVSPLCSCKVLQCLERYAAIRQNTLTYIDYNPRSIASFACISTRCEFPQ